jgi:hypothetical protein
MDQKISKMIKDCCDIVGSRQDGRLLKWVRYRLIIRIHARLRLVHIPPSSRSRLVKCFQMDHGSGCMRTYTKMRPKISRYLTATDGEEVFAGTPRLKGFTRTGGIESNTYQYLGSYCCRLCCTLASRRVE